VQALSGIGKTTPDASAKLDVFFILILNYPKNIAIEIIAIS
jgi:hypothetical protein